MTQTVLKPRPSQVRRRGILSALGVSIFAAGAFTASSAQQSRLSSPSSRISMLGDSLGLWFRWAGVPYPGLGGLPPGTPIGDGRSGVPLGVDGYPNLFELQTVGGERVLRVSGKVYGALTTKGSYGNFHLRLQYRWLGPKFPPRRPDQPRDSGILFHLTGGLEDAHWSVFLMGLESQISEGRTGDLLFMANKDDTVVPTVSARTSDGKNWSRTASYRTVGGRGQDSIFSHHGDFETSGGGWTTVDVYTIEDRGVSMVNGRVVSAYEDAAVIMPDGSRKPLTFGRIQLQSEGAEMLYRNVTIEPIAAIPPAIRQAAGLETDG